MLSIGVLQANAQVLVADAGVDKYVCMPWSATVFDTTQIGGTPTAQGGVPPYTYKWYITPVHAISSLYYYTSDYITDSTAANPLIKSLVLHDNDSMLIYLEVTDSIGSKAYDTVQIFSSSYLSSFTLGNFIIASGDSVFSGYVAMGGGIPPLQWLWKPNHGIVDSTQQYPGWLKPTQPVTDYICTVIDRFGCADTGGGTRVTVYPLNTEDITQEQNITAYPNPVKDYLALSPSKNLAVLSWSMYSSTGQCVLKSKTRQDLNINFSNLAEGTYLLHINSSKGIIRKKVNKVSE
jgi:hypothetical protein